MFPWLKIKKPNKQSKRLCLRESVHRKGNPHSHNFHGDPREGGQVQIPFSRGNALLSRDHGPKIHDPLDLFLATLPLHSSSPCPCLLLRQDFSFTLCRRYFLPPQRRGSPPWLRRRPPWPAPGYSPQFRLIR